MRSWTSYKLHRNKLMRKDSLGKAAMTSAYTTACEALSAHDAVKSEVYDEQEDGERDDEVENLSRESFWGVAM